VNAVQYAALVGKYIRMERPATDLEQAAGDPPTIGMECIVAQVYDSATPGVVMICSDDGHMFAVGAGQPVWRFGVWPDESTAKGHERTGAERPTER
jgi:hypothetical protein